MPGFVDGGPLNIRLRVAFGADVSADPATWVWTDITAWWHPDNPVDIQWGRSPGADQAETASLALTLKNTDGRFTAFDPRSPYWPNVEQWTPITYDIDLGDGIWRNRFSGFVRKWPVTWPGRSARQALAAITAVGILGRAGRGKPPARPPMRRSILGSADLVAYLPYEDGGDSGQGASALPGHPAAIVTGTVEFEQLKDTILSPGGQQDYGTGPLPNLNKGGRLKAVLPMSATMATSSQWTIQISAAVDVSSASSDVVLLDWQTSGGTYVRWQLWYQKSDQTTKITVYTAGGTQTTIINSMGTFFSLATTRVTAQQSGANIIVRMYEQNDTPSDPADSVTIAGTLGGITTVVHNSSGATAAGAMVFGHLAVWSTVTPAYRLTYAADGYGVFRAPADRSYDDEAAHLRLVRQGAEDGVTVTVLGAPADESGVTRMGRQPAGTAIDLYQTCETTDQGLLYETGFGLGYLPRSARYNLPVTLTIDAQAGQLGMPFAPSGDDVQLRNKITVTRPGGSSAVADDPASIERQGEIEGSVTAHLYDDGQLRDHAGWRLHLATVKEPRYNEVRVDLGAHRELAAAWVTCQPGSRIQVVNPPEQNVPGTVDQLVVGGRETFTGRRSWKASMNVEPASPWTIAEVDGPLRVGTDDSVLAAQFADTATLLLVRDPNPWVTGDIGSNPVDFPMDVVVDGEPITVSQITGVVNVRLSGNHSFETDLTGWAGTDAAVTRTNAQAQDGLWSALVTPNGVGANPRIEAVGTNQVPVVPGQTISVDARIRPTTANKTIQIGIGWYNAAGVFLSASTTTLAPVAGTWQYLGLDVTAPVGAAKAAARAGLIGTPAVGDTVHVDQLNVFVRNVQWFTVAPGDQVLSSNESFETDLTGWTGVNATAGRSIAQAQDGVASALVTPIGSGTVARVEATAANRYPVVPGQGVAADAWIRPTTGNKPITVQIAWRDTAGVFISSDVVTAPAVAGTWQYLASPVFVAPTGAAFACVGAGLGSTPAATDTCHVDQLRALAPARGRDGWTRTHDAGAPVDVAAAAIVAL